MVELYHWEPNGFYLKPLIALHEKGVTFTSHYIDPTDFQQTGPADLNLEAQYNPEIEGPILVDGGEAITESFFMLEYIDEAWPQAPKLLPGDPEGNWRVRVWARILGERTAPAMATLGCARYLAPQLRERGTGGVPQRFTRQEQRDAWRQALDGSYSAEDIEESRRKAADAVSRVEEALAAGDWLLGGRYSATDIDAFALLNALPKLEPALLNETVAPRTMAWLERMRARPAVKAALATAKSQAPDEAFAPGPEHARWG